MREAVYFSIRWGGTADISFTDQMSCISLFIIVEVNEVEVRESFFGFITEHGQRVMIWRRWFRIDRRKRNLILKKCKRKVFDNAASMAWVHGGVKRLLRKINEKTQLVPFCNHSLNLWSVHASAGNARAITFVGVIKRLCTFFLFQSLLGSVIFVCEGHDEEFRNPLLECTLRSYSCSENQISWSHSGTQFINLIFRKSSNDRGCTHLFVFNQKLLHVTYLLLGSNSWTNTSHAKETLRIWY